MRAYRLIRQMLLLNFGVLTLAGVSMAETEDSVETVSKVNLNRYVGTWYEIVRLPNRFQEQCVGNIAADYRRLDDGNIEVANRCQDGDGMIDDAQWQHTIREHARQTAHYRIRLLWAVCPCTGVKCLSV